MGQGYWTSGSRKGDRNLKSRRPTPKTDGRRNGGNPPGCMTFIGFLMLLGVAVALLLAYVNTRG